MLESIPSWLQICVGMFAVWLILYGIYRLMTMEMEEGTPNAIFEILMDGTKWAWLFVVIVIVLVLMLPLVLPICPFLWHKGRKHQQWAEQERQSLESSLCANLTHAQKIALATEWNDFGKMLAQRNYGSLFTRKELCDNTVAIAAIRRANELFREAWNSKTGDIESGLGVARTCNNLAALLFEADYNEEEGAIRFDGTPSEHFARLLEARMFRECSDQLYESLYNSHPRNLNIRAGYATVLQGRGNSEESKRVLDEILEEQPDHQDARMRLEQLKQREVPKLVLHSIGAGEERRERKVYFDGLLDGFDSSPDRGDLVDSAEVGRDVVDCTVFAPPKARPGESLMVQVFLHLPLQSKAIRESAEEFDAEAKKRGVSSLTAEVVRGSRIDIQLEMVGLTIDEPVQTFVWRGVSGSLQFEITVPKRMSPQRVVGKLMVFQDSAPIGRIRFVLMIVRPWKKARSEESRVGEAERFRTGFVSYAAEDRAEVLRRVQGLRAAGIRCFQDILDLDPGLRWERELYRHIDESDALFLFWSTAAKNSEWVEREWKYAVDHRGDEFVIPVVIEGPPPVPPPPELSHVHFNDKILYFIHAD